MSLKVFHLVFITLAALICVAAGVWLIDAAREGSRPGYETVYYVLGGVFLAAGGGLIYYAFRFFRKFRDFGRPLLACVAAAAFAWPTPEASACATCSAAVQTAQGEALGMSILTLGGFILSVLTGFAFFIAYLRKRARLHAGADTRAGGN